MNPIIQQHWRWKSVQPEFQGAWIQVRDGIHHKNFPPHDHDFHELVIVLGGSAWHRTIESEQKIQKGTALLIPAGTWHAYIDCKHLNILMWLLHPQLVVS